MSAGTFHAIIEDRTQAPYVAEIVVTIDTVEYQAGGAALSPAHGEVYLRWYMLDDLLAVKLEAFDDSWPALAASGLLQLLAPYGLAGSPDENSVSPDEVMVGLESLGYRREA